MWEKERVLILVKAAPNWSTKYKKYEVCTAGISEDEGWRRLYPFPESVMVKKDIRLWEIIEVETRSASPDPRPESRKIKPGSIRKVDYIDDREERRRFLKEIEEKSLDIPIEDKRTMTVVKPQIEDFAIKRLPEPYTIQLTLNGDIFKRYRYGNIELRYIWRCSDPCQICKNSSHNMKCFDWEANYLYTKYKTENEAISRTIQMCFYKLKKGFDVWFALGTHSQRPWRQWMVVGLLKIKKKQQNQWLITKIDSFF